MRFDDRVKALVSASCFICFTVYFANVMVMSLGANMRLFPVG